MTHSPFRGTPLDRLLAALRFLCGAQPQLPTESDEETTGFLLPDSWYCDVGLNRDHEEVAGEALDWAGIPAAEESAEHQLGTYGVIRFRGANGDDPPSLHLFTAPTRAQRRAIARMVRSGGGWLHFDLERRDATGRWSVVESSGHDERAMRLCGATLVEFLRAVERVYGR